jgi:O-antigen/teichoic acid export membrane protein
VTPAAEPPRAGIATHYLRYLSSNVLVVAAGFVSFPVMARLLDNRQFGLLGYYEACLLLVAGVLKLGTQHVILRFYPHRGGAGALAAFRSNHVLAPFGLTLAAWAACLAIAALILPRIPAAERPLLGAILLTVPLVIWCSLVEAVMYALERSDITVWLKTLWRWGEVAFVIGALLLFERSALGVLGAKLLVVVLVAAWLTWWFRRWSPREAAPVSKAPVLAGLAFGLPMMANELTSVVFGFADRLMLRGLTGDLHDVGVYTIGQGLAIAVSTVVGATLAQAFTPTAVRLYESEGPAAVVDLKRRMLDVWLMAVSVGSALLLCAGGDFMVLMAGPDKAGSGPVFVTVALAMIWYSLLDIAQYGMLLQRRAARHLSITLVATLLKLALNVPLILRFGVMGAAWASVASYAVLAWLQYRQCPPELRYLPPLRRLPLAFGFPLACLGLLHAVDWFGAVHVMARLAVSGLTVLVPAVLVVLLDASFRQRVRDLFARKAASA